MSNDILMSRNELVQFLRKPADEFTSDDIVRFIEAKGIKMVNFRYAAGDGKLKSLKRFKDDVSSVEAGQEFGFGLEDFNDIKDGDTFEAYKLVEIAKTLA